MAVNFNILVLTINECNCLLKINRNIQKMIFLLTKNQPKIINSKLKNIIVENIRFKLIINTKQLKLVNTLVLLCRS